MREIVWFVLGVVLIIAGQRFSLADGDRKGVSGRGEPLADDSPGAASLDLYWIPLGAGAHIVRVSGAIYEASLALVQRRPRQRLFHSALIATTSEGQVVVEMTPIPDECAQERGVVAEGSVGLRWAGHFRLFRYEVRRWVNGLIDDISHAVGSPVRVTNDRAVVQRLLDLVPLVPTPVWGRDELNAGEMWNCNSITAWLLASLGVDDAAGHPPLSGRAPGWDAGIVVARRMELRDRQQAA